MPPNEAEENMVESPICETPSASSAASELNVEATVAEPNRVEIQFTKSDLEEEDAIPFPGCTPLALPDDVSVTSDASLAYFEPADFQPSNWMQSVDVPTFGLAVIAVAAAVVHPIMFLAGALTIFGTATAYGASPNCAPDMTWCSKNTATDVDLEATEPSSAKADIPDDTTNSSSHSPEPSVPTEMPKFSEDLFALGTSDERDLIDQQFPVLENSVVADESFVGLNVSQFFDVFFADNAPFSFLEFQKKRGDLNIEYGSWKDESTQTSLSMMVEDKPFPVDLDYLSYRRRVLTFKAKTNSFMGPKFATTTRTQRVLIVSKKLAILESKTVLADIPFSDRFFVMERWYLTAKKENGRYTTFLSSSCQVIFTNKCPFDQQIRSKSKSTVTAIGVSWCEMAQEALKLTEQAKRDRLMREGDQQYDSDAEQQEKPEENSGATDKQATDSEIDGENQQANVEVSWYPTPKPPQAPSLSTRSSKKTFSFGNGRRRKGSF